MSDELTAAAVVSAGGLFRRKAVEFKPGAPCANCETPLQGPWCHACGQQAEDFHRSVFRLLGEAVEGLTHFDGRFWRTVPDLIRNPGRLTRNYIQGHRASQIPPLRLFLVVLLLVFVTGSLAGADIDLSGASKLDQGQRAKISASVDQVQVDFGKRNEAATQWLRGRLKAAIANPERFGLILEQWSERFAFLMLPVATLLLTILFAFKRKFFVFDHTIFALHSMSAQGLLLTVGIVAGRLGAPAAWLLLLSPAHLFLHMRGAYGSSVLATLARMFLLALGSFVGAILLILGLVSVGLAELGSA